MSAGVHRILDWILGYRQAKALSTAAYLELFAETDRPRSAAEIARSRGLDPRATEILLDALTAMEVLVKRGGCYRNTAMARRHLVPGRHGYFGDNLKFQEIIWDAWSDLRGSLRRGGAVRPLDYWLLKHPDFTREYIRGMANIAKGPAAAIAAMIKTTGPMKILDVGAGPGTYSLALLRKNSEAIADLFDLPGTLRQTRRLVGADPARSRLRFVAGDYKVASFGRHRYDVILMSHITHDEGPEVNAELARKAYHALKRGGCLLIHDFMVDNTRTRPLFGALFSVHMLAYTANGRTYTEREYRSWLRDAGLVPGRAQPVGIAAANSTRLLVGVKP